MTAFYVLGGVLAAWALLVTALGVTRHDFPGKGSGSVIVGGISVVLVIAAIASAIVTAANEDEEEERGEAEAAQVGGQPEGEEGGPQEDAPLTESEGAGGPAGGGGSALTLRADPGGGLEFDKTELIAAAGKVTITMTNPSSNPHNVAVEGNGVDDEGEIVTDGDSSTVSPELEPGEYTFYCSVPGHREGGMEGTLTVTG